MIADTETIGKSAGDGERSIVEHLITGLWLAVLVGVLAILVHPVSRALFITLTTNHPYLMGTAKFALLGSMGDRLSGKLASGKWQFRGQYIAERALVWALLGASFALVFPLFSFGVDGALEAGLLPGNGNIYATAFWKSFLMQLIFAFPFMSFHRVSDTIIDRGAFFHPRRWRIVDTFQAIDWKNMFHVVGGSIFWFWLPVHTFNFLLLSVFRVIVAALLAVVLGFILGLAKRISQRGT